MKTILAVVLLAGCLKAQTVGCMTSHSPACFQYIPSTQDGYVECDMSGTGGRTACGMYVDAWMWVHNCIWKWTLRAYSRSQSWGLYAEATAVPDGAPAKSYKYFQEDHCPGPGETDDWKRVSPRVDFGC